MIISYVFAGIFSTQIQHQIHSLLYYFLLIFISLMRSQQSIQIPYRLDRSRKALMTQLTANIAKIAASTPKRSKAQEYDEWHDLQTLKKKQHIDVNAQDKKQNANLLKQNDRKFCTQKQIPIKPNTFSDPKTLDSTQKKTFKNINKQESFDPNFQPFKPTDLNLMLDHKLYNSGNLSVQDSKLFSEKERLLISIQEKLDSHLLFLKEHRKKKKGELFSIIKKTFLENYRIFLEFSHVKKILYICENFYSIQKFGEGFSFEFLIDIKLSSKQSDQKNLQDELKERKNQFRSKLFSYKENFEGNTNTKQFEIPEVKFQFQQAIEKKNNVLKSSMKQLFDGQLIKKKKLDRFFVLEKKNSTVYEESKKNLQKGMKKVESIIMKEKELNLGRISNKIFEKRQLNEKQIKAIIHEIIMIYRQKTVMNMLECQLVEGLSKKLILAEGILSQVVEIFLELSPKVNKSKPFMTPINHKLGKIIKLDSSNAQEFEKCVTTNTEWMKLFQFEIEMNGEYLKGKMQQQRDKLYQQLDREEKQRNLKDEREKDLKDLQSTPKQIKNKREEQNPPKMLKNIKSLIKVIASEQQQKANYLQSHQNRNFTNINVANGDSHLSIQKDDFNSTLSNSAQIFYQDENLLDNQARC